MQIKLIDSAGNTIASKVPNNPVGNLSMVQFRGRFYSYCRIDLPSSTVVFMEVPAPVEFEYV